MKKSLFLFLALFLTSCTNKYNVDPIKTTEISVWVPAKEEIVIREIIDDWNKSQNDNYDFNVKIRKIASPETMSIISKNPTSQDNPTLFLGNAADLYKFENKDIIASIPVEEKNKLEWVVINEKLLDNSKFAGNYNIPHIIKQIQVYLEDNKI